MSVCLLGNYIYALQSSIYLCERIDVLMYWILFLLRFFFFLNGRLCVVAQTQKRNAHVLQFNNFFNGISVSVLWIMTVFYKKINVYLTASFRLIGLFLYHPYQDSVVCVCVWRKRKKTSISLAKPWQFCFFLSTVSVTWLVEWHTRQN